MGSKWSKFASDWIRQQVFQDEALVPRQQTSNQTVPPEIRAARSLDPGTFESWQSREATFVKQGKLLASYEDDFVYENPVQRYYPTYQSLTNPELRGYFSWRTRLRKGDLQRTSLTYAYLYIYELLNQIGVAGAMEGYGKLSWFRDAYGELDERILPYMDSWLWDYVVYHRLDPALLAEDPKVVVDNAIAVIAEMDRREDPQILDAVHTLSPRWLGRSKFYAERREDMDAVIPRVLRRVWEHYNTRCKSPMVEQLFGAAKEYPVRMFQAAVFHHRLKHRNCEYRVDPVRVYRCRDGLWSVERYADTGGSVSRLEDILKTVDAVMRQAVGYGSSIKPGLDTKWILKIIREEVNSHFDRKKADEAKTLRIDYSQLAAIRADAAVTRDKLVVDEEEEEELPPEPRNEAPDSPLSVQEYRLLQCLLYGRDLSWVRSQGLMLSVLVDGINEKLFDTFADSVLTMDEPPELIEDYINDLKEAVAP